MALEYISMRNKKFPTAEEACLDCVIGLKPKMHLCPPKSFSSNQLANSVSFGAFLLVPLEREKSNSNEQSDILTIG